LQSNFAIYVPTSVMLALKNANTTTLTIASNVHKLVATALKNVKNVEGWLD
jgi:hypothetical protein